MFYFYLSDLSIRQYQSRLINGDGINESWNGTTAYAPSRLDLVLKTQSSHPSYAMALNLRLKARFTLSSPMRSSRRIENVMFVLWIIWFSSLATSTGMDPNSQQFWVCSLHGSFPCTRSICIFSAARSQASIAGSPNRQKRTSCSVLLGAAAKAS